MTVLPDSVANRIAEELTPTEGRVLDFIVAFRDQYDRFPNDHDMRGEFASGSLQAVRYHVDKLEKKGWLAIRRMRSLAPGGRVTHSDRRVVSRYLCKRG